MNFGSFTTVPTWVPVTQGLKVHWYKSKFVRFVPVSIQNCQTSLKVKCLVN